MIPYFRQEIVILDYFKTAKERRFIPVNLIASKSLHEVRILIRPATKYLSNSIKATSALKKEKTEVVLVLYNVRVMCHNNYCKRDEQHSILYPLKESILYVRPFQT